MYQIKVTYTFKDFVALNRLYEKTMQKWKNYLVRPFFIILGLFVLILTVLLIIIDGMTWENTLCLLSGTASLLLGFFSHYLNALQTKYMVLGQVLESTFTFEDDGFAEENTKGITKRPYSSIFALQRYADRYFVFLDKRHAYVLPLTALADIDREEFECFVSSKSGKEWQYVGKPPKVIK